jgi:hypothetical protein
MVMPEGSLIEQVFAYITDSERLQVPGHGALLPALRRAFW